MLFNNYLMYKYYIILSGWSTHFKCQFLLHYIFFSLDTYPKKSRTNEYQCYAAIVNLQANTCTRGHLLLRTAQDITVEPGLLT